MALQKTIEQGRASEAYKYADRIPPVLKGKFKSHVKKFPMLVKTNGLGASVAFLFSKGDKEQGVYKNVGESIVEWLKYDDKYKTYGLKSFSSLKELTEEVVKLDSTNYRALTIEVIAYFTWLRRFAEGLS